MDEPVANLLDAVCIVADYTIGNCRELYGPIQSTKRRSFHLNQWSSRSDSEPGRQQAKLSCSHLIY